MMGMDRNTAAMHWDHLMGQLVKPKIAANNDLLKNRQHSARLSVVYKPFGSRSGQTKCQACSGSKLFDTLGIPEIFFLES